MALAWTASTQIATVAAVSLVVMRNVTHELIGVCAAVAAAQVLPGGPPETVALAVGALYGARLPDVDVFGARVHRRTGVERRSLLAGAVGLLVRLPALLLALALRHRGAAHWLLTCALFTAGALGGALLAGASPLVVAVAAGASLGYLTHVLADACTPTGVSLWAPVSPRPVWLLPVGARVATGSARELLVSGAAAALIVALLFV